MSEGGGAAEEVSGADAASGRDPAPATRRLTEMQRRELSRAIAKTLARAIGSAVLLLVAYYVIPLGSGSDVAVGAKVVLAGVLVVGLVAWEIRAVSRSHLPQLRAIDALAVTVTVIVVAFAWAYIHLSRHDPDAFNESLGRTSSLYFTLTTLATIGYGDIHATTDVARIAVMAQMVCNVAVIGASVKLIMGTARYRLGIPHQPRP
ncbi:MAG: potassium channel family protein [Ilumatobacteraceae bacterium]